MHPSTAAIAKLISVTEIIKREYLKLPHTSLVGLYQYNELGTLEDLGLSPHPQQEDGEDVEMVRSQAIIEALDGVKKFVTTIYTAVCLLTGLNSIRIQRTPYMRVALSPREILDLAAVTHPATCVLCVFRDR